MERMELAGKRVLVLGTGVTGRSAALFCAERGARVTLADERPAEASDAELRASLPQGVALVLGLAFPDRSDFDLVVPSPGIARARYAEGAKRIWGDIELAYRALRIPIAAVTGTNGKSTTVTLLAEMLQAAGWRAEAAGNLGEPALSLVGRPLDCAVLEVSSFQLEAIDAFAPRVGVWLNLSPDHLDRHGSVEAYRDAKRAMFLQQSADDWAVVNEDDDAVREATRDLPGQRLPFRTRGPLEHGLWLDGPCAMLSLPEGTRRIRLEGALLAGAHNRENLLAALGAVWALGADVDAAARALASYRGLPHRCELVAEIGGVRFVNDSKATNAGAAARALESFDAPVLWIAGGRDKGLDFAPLRGVAEKCVRHAYLIGEAAASLEKTLADAVETTRASSLEEAVQLAAAAANPGEVVLLSPACASFDQFANFGERGERFRDAVRALDEAGGPH